MSRISGGVAVGAHHGTFGNMLPYFTSFMRQLMGEGVGGIFLCAK